MSKVRRDVVIASMLAGHFRLAMCVLFLPHGYSLTCTKSEHPDEKHARRGEE